MFEVIEAPSGKLEDVEDDKIALLKLSVKDLKSIIKCMSRNERMKDLKRAHYVPKTKQENSDTKHIKLEIINII